MPLFHRAPTIVVVVFLGAHLLLAHWQPFCAWGVDLLAFHPGWVQVLFLLGAVSLLWPRSRQAALDILAKCSTAFANKPWLVHLLLALAGGAAFITWPSAVHFLGDGYLYLHELPLTASQNIQRVGHEPLTFWLLNLLL